MGECLLYPLYPLLTTNNNGPKQEPWGSPQSRLKHAESVPLTDIYPLTSVRHMIRANSELLPVIRLCFVTDWWGSRGWQCQMLRSSLIIQEAWHILSPYQAWCHSKLSTKPFQCCGLHDTMTLKLGRFDSEECVHNYSARCGLYQKNVALNIYFWT